MTGYNYPSCNVLANRSAPLLSREFPLIDSNEGLRTK
jgi:hypothetical protein